MVGSPAAKTMPGTLPEMRRRRLAPVPCSLRSKAVNFIVNSKKRNATMASRGWKARDQALPYMKPGHATGPRDACKWRFCSLGRAGATGGGFHPDGLEIVVLLREQGGHRFAIRNAADRLREQEGH